MNTDELTAGPELDRLVAEACGIEYETNPNPSGLHEWRSADCGGGVSICSVCGKIDHQGYLDAPAQPGGCKPPPILFRPSTDWNDAMEAAERFRLFAGDLVLDCTRGGHWNVLKLTEDDCIPIVYGKSGPLVISRAIIREHQLIAGSSK